MVIYYVKKLFLGSISDEIPGKCFQLFTHESLEIRREEHHWFLAQFIAVDVALDQHDAIIRILGVGFLCCSTQTPSGLRDSSE